MKNIEDEMHEIRRKINDSLENTSRDIESRLNKALGVSIKRDNRMDKMEWTYSKSVPQMAFGSLKLDNGVEVVCSCLAENLKHGPYELSIMDFNNGYKNITDSVVDNHREGKKYARPQIEKIIADVAKRKPYENSNVISNEKPRKLTPIERLIHRIPDHLELK